MITYLYIVVKCKYITLTITYIGYKSYCMDTHVDVTEVGEAVRWLWLHTEKSAV